MADEQREKDIKDLITQFSQQQAGMQPQQQFSGNPNQGIDGHSGIDNQGSINESAPINPNILTPSKGPAPIPTGNVCPQCNMVHPPIPHGQKCPNATVKAMTGESTEVVIDVNKYLLNLRNILMTHIDKKKIEDINKLFQNITLEMTKYLEGYKE